MPACWAYDRVATPVAYGGTSLTWAGCTTTKGDGMSGELSARVPTAVWLNLAELDTVASALAQTRPRRGRDRQHDRLARKISRIRDRKLKRARGR
jgi:hypothetical protein